MAGQLWRSMLDKDKHPWVRMAHDEKAAHARQYPGYRYAPSSQPQNPIRSKRRAPRGKQMPAQSGVQASMHNEFRVATAENDLHSSPDAVPLNARQRRHSSCPPPGAELVTTSSPREDSYVPWDQDPSLHSMSEWTWPQRWDDSSVFTSSESMSSDSQASLTLPPQISWPSNPTPARKSRDDNSRRPSRTQFWTTHPKQEESEEALLKTCEEISASRLRQPWALAPPWASAESPIIVSVNSITLIRLTQSVGGLSQSRANRWGRWQRQISRL